MKNEKIKLFLMGCGCLALMVMFSFAEAILWLRISGAVILNLPGDGDATTQTVSMPSQSGTPIVTLAPRPSN